MNEGYRTGAEAGPDPGDERRPPTDYLRVSITDRCNLRCVYCMPAEGVANLPRGEVLRYEELELFVRAAVETGIERVRVTGGEPLVRKGAPGFIGRLKSISPDLRVSLTTNGVLLGRFIDELKEAGLGRVNISLDSLDPDVYRMITRLGELKEALGGLKAAVEAGLDPVKINVVVLRGINDDPGRFVELTREMPVHVRFIEYMPYFGNPGGWFVPGDVIKEKIARRYALEEVEPPEGWGPASYCRAEGAPGTLGFISPVSCHFCPSCNRLRISAEGMVRTCLFDGDGLDVRRELRSGADIARLREIIEGELSRKRRQGAMKPGPGSGIGGGDHMFRIGG